MIDLHTHILPDWDDGARSWDEAAKMCAIAKEDGTAKIAVTPHIYRLNKYDNDWVVLEERIAQIKERAAEWGIEIYRGAEVFVHHDMAREMRTRNLTLNGTDYVFVEFPQDSVLPGVKDLFYGLMMLNFIPIISHPERNLVFAERPDLLYDLVTMGALAQVTGKSVCGDYGGAIKKTAELFLTHNLVHIIASDAHDPEKRPPKLRKAVDEAAEFVGREKAEAMVTAIPQALLDNKEIPDWGEPINPVKRKKRFAFKVPWGRGGGANDNTNIIT